MRAPLRKLAARLVLLTVSAVATLLIAEMVVRLVRPQAAFIVSPGLYEDDPPRGYRLTPGFRGRMTNRVEYDTEAVINRLGLRGPEVEPLPSEGVRILVLGDSFAFGVGAEQEESYPARMEEILGERGVRAQVLNAGTPGYSVPDAVTWFQAHGRALDPDVVLLTVFTGNDLQDAAPGGPRIVVKDGHLVPAGKKRRPLSLWLNQHSHLFSLLKSSSLGRPVRRLLGRPEAFEDWVIRTEMDLYATDSPSDLAARGAAVTERAVGDLVRSAGRARVAAVIVPSLLQVDPDLWKATLGRLGLDPTKHDPDRTTRMFLEMFARQGVPALDLSGPFREAISKGQRVYFPVDRHLTPEGYGSMAREVVVFSSGELEIGFREVVPGTEERAPRDPGDRVTEAVPEIETGWMPTLPKPAVSDDRFPPVLLTKGDDPNPELVHKIFQRLTPSRPDSTSQDNSRLGQCWCPSAREGGICDFGSELFRTRLCEQNGEYR